MENEMRSNREKAKGKALHEEEIPWMEAQGVWGKVKKKYMEEEEPEEFMGRTGPVFGRKNGKKSLNFAKWAKNVGHCQGFWEQFWREKTKQNKK